ncbi:MAG: hypothetical protein R2706_00490 [Acidimicrobiales bacterium]
MGATIMTTDDALLVIDTSPTFDDFYRTYYPTLVRALVVGLRRLRPRGRCG